MSSVRLSARFLQGLGIPRDQVRALQQASIAVTGGVPQTWTWISNDGGVTWLPAASSPTTLTVTFYRGAQAIATQSIVGTRDDPTGNITLTVGAHTGEPVTVPAMPAASQLVGVTITHTESGAQTYLAWQSLKDGTALGGYGGGSGPGK